MTSTGKVLRVTSPLWRDCLKVFLKNLLEKIPVFSQPFPEFFLYIQTCFYFSLSWWSHTASVMLLSLTEHECFMRFSCQHLIILAYYIITLYHPFSPVKKKKSSLGWLPCTNTIPDRVSLDCRLSAWHLDEATRRSSDLEHFLGLHHFYLNNSVTFSVVNGGTEKWLKVDLIH